MSLNIAVIVAAGSGKRMGTDKQLMRIGGRTVIEITTEKFQESSCIDRIIIVASESNIDEIRKITKERGFGKVGAVVPGGSERYESVRNGLLAAEACVKAGGAEDTDAEIAGNVSGNAKCNAADAVVLIHDGARPFVTEEIIERCAAAAERAGAACVCVPVKDTLKQVKAGGAVSTPRRSEMYAAQTPQGFRFSVIKELYDKYKADGTAVREITDDSMLAELAGIPTEIVAGDYKNIKLTTPEDLYMAEIIAGAVPKEYITSIGQDSHRFGDENYQRSNSDRSLVLGGVSFEGEPVLEANSDGDVVLHAITNAVSGITGVNILGAAADAMCRAGITDSSAYLQEALRHMRNMKITHLSLTIECLRPKLAGSIEKMKASIAQIMGISKENVGITATTGEGLTQFGTGAGMQVFCIATAMSL